jgi:hypothetical protein
VARTNGDACIGVAVVYVLILTGVAGGIDGGAGEDPLLKAVAPLVGGGAGEVSVGGLMLSSCCKSLQILWMSLSISCSDFSVLGLAFVDEGTPPPLLCLSLAPGVEGLALPTIMGCLDLPSSDELLSPCFFSSTSNRTVCCTFFSCTLFVVLSVVVLVVFLALAPFCCSSCPSSFSLISLFSVKSVFSSSSYDLRTLLNASLSRFIEVVVVVVVFLCSSSSLCSLVSSTKWMGTTVSFILVVVGLLLP